MFPLSLLSFYRRGFFSLHPGSKCCVWLHEEKGLGFYLSVSRLLLLSVFSALYSHPPHCLMCWSKFPSEHHRCPTGMGKVYNPFAPGDCALTQPPLALPFAALSSLSPTAKQLGLPLPSEPLCRNQAFNLPRAAGLLCDSPLLPVLPTFQKCASILCLLLSPRLFS